ncbi:IucA/IucC family protein, partial [Staphylococcus arlettae]
YLIAGDVAEEAALMETLGLTDIQVKQLLREHEVTAADYMVFPVHPWQWEHIIRPMFQGELATGVIVPLNYKFGNYVSSSSIRSLIDVQDPFHHLKVPFAMQSLGALRLTPT